MLKSKRNIILLITLITFVGLLSSCKISEHLFNESINNMKKVNIGSISFFYNDEESSNESIEMIKSFIPQVNKNISILFSTGKEENLNIILYDDKKDLLKYAKGLNNIDGYYDSANNSIHLINFNIDLEEWEYEKLFMHEYTHYKFDLFLKENKIKASSIPVWFHEGIAEYVGYNGSILEYSPLSLAKEKDFKSMNTTEEFEQARLEKYNPYLQSCYAIDKLIKTNKEGVIANIILKTKDMDFYKAFQSVTKMNIDEFQKVYLKERKDDYNKRVKK